MVFDCPLSCLIERDDVTFIFVSPSLTPWASNKCVLTWGPEELLGNIVLATNQNVPASVEEAHSQWPWSCIVTVHAPGSPLLLPACMA